MHTIQNFHACCPTAEIIVVLPETHHKLWYELCQKHHFDITHKVVPGGSERFYSVKNGLEATSPQSEITAIHDGVRPFASRETIERCIQAAILYGAAIPSVPLIDSIRHIESDGNNHAVTRSEYAAVQTPQCFSTNLLRRAYNQPFSTHFTDDASVVEAAGGQIHLVQGNVENIKITTPADMAVAEYYIERSTSSDRNSPKSGECSL